MRELCQSGTWFREGNKLSDTIIVINKSWTILKQEKEWRINWDNLLRQASENYMYAYLSQTGVSYSNSCGAQCHAEALVLHIAQAYYVQHDIHHKNIVPTFFYKGTEFEEKLINVIIYVYIYVTWITLMNNVTQELRFFKLLNLMA